MNTRFGIKCLSALLSCIIKSIAGEFNNITFDEPTTNRLDPVFLNGRLLFRGDATRLVPGWVVKYDKAPVSSVYFSDNTGGDGVTLVQNIPRLQDLYGNFSIGVYGFQYVKDSEPAPVSIELSQSGLIPNEVVGIRYFSGDLGFRLFVNGEQIGDESGYADLTRFSGSEVKIDLWFPPRYAGDFDIIGFTTVPEPSEFAMLGLGLGVIGWQVWKRQRAHLLSVRNGGGRGSTHAPTTPADPM